MLCVLQARRPAFDLRHHTDEIPLTFLLCLFVTGSQEEPKDSSYKWYAVIAGCLVMFFILLSLS